MIKKLVIANAATLVACLLAQTAAAQDNNFYVAGALGASIDGSFEGNWGGPLGDLNPTSGTFDSGAVARIGVGYGVLTNVRAEVELGYHALPISDEYTFSALPFDSEGDAKTLSLMLNGLYDFDISVPGYSIYAGAGIGVAKTEVNIRRQSGFQLSEGTSVAPAAQLRLGVERELENGMNVFADYTYLYLKETEFDGYNDAIGDADQIFSPIESHDLMVGVRYGF